jgi:hypothetical protein
MRRIIALIVVVLAAGAAHATGTAGTTYYVSPSGSDSNPGSASAPWRTVARVNTASLLPGDTVLLQGGANFADTLIPPASGTATSPISFGSYGTGSASIASAGGGVWIPAARHDLIFDNLNLSSSSSIVFAATGSGTGTYNITLRNSTVHDSPYSGLDMQPQDSMWTISGNTFRHLGDDGLLIQGAQATIDTNTITDTGWNPAITYGKHGIYAKGPNVTIANNDISSDTNGSGISLRYGGARVFGNAIHDTPYAISLFPQDPANTGVDRIYSNRFWNITGFLFYYAGTNSVAGAPSGIGVTWTSNTSRLAGASEAVNVSEVTSAASVTIANSVFYGTYGSAYRGCATCSEHHNDWYGGTSNIPSGVGDTHVAPGLTAAPTLAPSSSSSVVDAGTTSVSSTTYLAGCDAHPMDYCFASPDQGAVEYTGAAGSGDTTAPTPPASVSFSNQTQTGGTLSWAAASDNVAVTGYDVYVDGARVGSSPTSSFVVSGLACGTSHTFGIAAYDAAGNHSSTSSTTGSTTPCPSSAPTDAPTVSFTNAADGSVVSRSYTFTVSAAGSSAIASLALSVDGGTVCSTGGASLDCTVNHNGGWHTVTATAVSTGGQSGSASVRVRFAR